MKNIYYYLSLKVITIEFVKSNTAETNKLISQKLIKHRTGFVFLLYFYYLFTPFLGRVCSINLKHPPVKGHQRRIRQRNLRPAVCLYCQED